MDPTQKSPERALALQKYLLLHSQHDALQKHLDQISAFRSSSLHSQSPSSDSRSSRSSSEESRSFDLSSAPPPGRRHRRSGSIPSSRLQRPKIIKRRSSLPTIIDDTAAEEIVEDQLKLKDVNQQIKSTLTDLLNCKSVRSDTRYRMWVQTRLMDTEKELRSERRKSVDVNAML